LEAPYLHRQSSDNQEICEMFSDFFKSVYCVNDDSVVDDVIFPIKYDSLELSELSVLKCLQSLDCSKGAGPDGIPNSFLKCFCEQLVYPLTHIFNLSLRMGRLPRYWKLSHIIPIFKKGDRSDISNHRGISIISSTPKLFEKIVCDNISSFINPHIIPNQHGFFPGRSVLTNLCDFVSKTLNWMENGFQVDVIYTDFSKAFDRVDLH